MDMLILSLAAFAASAPPTGPAIGASPASHGAVSAARRSPGGAVATATISVRIVSTSARVGVGLAPPLPGMASRPATITAADGSQVAALIYDFE